MTNSSSSNKKDIKQKQSEPSYFSLSHLNPSNVKWVSDTFTTLGKPFEGLKNLLPESEQKQIQDSNDAEKERKISEHLKESDLEQDTKPQDSGGGDTQVRVSGSDPELPPIPGQPQSLQVSVDENDFPILEGPIWCSWCFRFSPQILLQAHLMGRNLYKCQLCYNFGAFCIGCAKATSRHYPGGGDKFCAVCNGTLKDWNDDEIKSLDHIRVYQRWCSWCLLKATHTIHRKPTLGRIQYKCDSCGKSTHRCSSCSDAMTRSTITWGDHYCFKCHKIFEDWSNLEENKKKLEVEGWCTWCVTKAKHVLEQDLPWGKTVYNCSNCGSRTLRCSSCNQGFTCGGYGWDDSFCAECWSETGDTWSQLAQKKEAIFNQHRVKERVIAELKRESKYRDWATQIGMLRPFLLLVAMAPILRCQVASYLGWSLLTKKEFGDSHAEAWQIVGSKNSGISSRCIQSYERLNPFVSTCNWYYVLHRTIESIFQTSQLPTLPTKETHAASNEKNHKTILKLEDEFLLNLVQTIKSQMSPEQIEAFENPTSEDPKKLSVVKTQIIKNSHITQDELANYAISVVCQANNISALSVTTTMLQIGAQNSATLATFFVPLGTNLLLLSTPMFFISVAGLVGTSLKFAFGSSETRLFVPITLILNQKVMLAAEGIDIGQFYD